VLARDPELAARSSRCSSARDGRRVLIVGRADEEQVAEISEYLAGVKLRAGDSLLLDPRSMLLYEKLPARSWKRSSSKRSRTSPTPISWARQPDQA